MLMACIIYTYKHILCAILRHIHFEQVLEIRYIHVTTSIIITSYCTVLDFNHECLFCLAPRQNKNKTNTSE